MLLFIGSILVKIAEDAEFQYTSCYSLSSSASCFSFLLPGFNTSHVTLYRCKGPRKCPGSLVSIHLMLLFIYSRWSLMRTKWRFNTSHVTLYLTAHEPDYPILKFQYISCYSLSRKGMGYGTSGMRVSIHLMLLFIWLCLYKVSCGLMFQYISCYSLSWNGEYKWDGTIRFNTSHVTLYLHPASQSSAHVRVSIHLMLLFIISFSTEFTILKTRFNTSHVTLYRLHE